MTDKVTFTINGKQHEVGADASADTSLSSYLHAQHLRGTRVTCGTGGCGSCMVLVTRPDPDSGDRTSYSALSCLIPVLGCDGWEVTTVEGLGNRFQGYHAIQDRLVEHYGTQCGYCSPGMVMSMFGMTQENSSWTESDVEGILDANLCRCTGYRPIVEAFKSVTVQDIEDSHTLSCPRTGQPCKGRCSVRSADTKASSRSKPGEKPESRLIQLKEATWYQPASLEELYGILHDLPQGAKYRFVCSDTGKAIFRDEGPHSILISTTSIPELSRVATAPSGVVFGANVSLSRIMSELSTAAQSLSGFGFVREIVGLWRRVGGTALRNMGSWAGNLAMKMAHRDFPSDVFVSLMAAGAVVKSGSPYGGDKEHTLDHLLDLDLEAERRVLLELRLPPMADDVAFRLFKIAPRNANVHAYMNAAFRMRVDSANAHTVIGRPMIIFGGINAEFLHAWGAEAALEDQSLEDEAVLQTAFKALRDEILPDNLPENPSAQYRIDLGQTLLYKTILGIVGDFADPSVAGGASDLERPLASGRQSYDQNPDRWPLSKPVAKVEGHIQCSGEAEFVADMPALCEELSGCFVTSTQANARIVGVDASAALAIPGVEGFVGIEDVTGVNNIQVLQWPYPEPLFPEERTSYYGQPLGLIVAKTAELSKQGAAAVVVTYEDIQAPVLTIQEAQQLPPPSPQADPFVEGDVEAGFAASTHVFEGGVGHDWQYHFYMENQATLAIPTDDGLDVFTASQWAIETQRSIGQVLGVPDNTVNVSVKRIGGGFGGKTTRGNIVATATCLAARKVRKPVRTVLDMATCMTMLGGRDPFWSTYKVGVDAEGRLQAVQATMTSDAGYVNVDPNNSTAPPCVPSCYTCPNWEITPATVLTNTPNNTWTRTPGSTEGITLMETILEHVAVALDLDPLLVRRRNLMPDGSFRHVGKGVFRLRCGMGGRDAVAIPDEVKVSKNMIGDMLTQLMTSADVEDRKQKVKDFNKTHLWKKRGLSVMTMMWPHVVPLIYPMNSLVTINQRDGSVAVSHGGTELGQGMNTKVVQVVAYELGCPMDVVAVKPSTSHANANSQCTNGALGSYMVSYSVSEACKKLRARLDAVKEALGRDAVSWQELIEEAATKGVDICERYWNGPGEVQSYPVFGVCCSEVELDVLTGQFLVLRTDILEDAGTSMSPLVDVTQVEGGFVMGQGLFTSERPIYDPISGRRISDGTWHYQVPTAHDIPADFRVSLLSNTPNPIGVLDSKATSEPAVPLSYTVLMALRDAVASARADGGTSGWFNIEAPFTVEKLQQLCLVEPSRMVLHPGGR
ncbi:indole-3-acetaldehyde oxidase-like [Penaeus japonicus]|uniref:indole-3-acetaldehyde oxidase-like n=1 Tax=Penaeus japonicus TaxID=27405 RepID=UPI001C7127DF|nr:indole-3-acetaldehyde oxidase-like [Penaeus japonicus]XP_042858617.1 indole-3-acetaldehyde oxidase-like [Penaeus japonicus]